MPELMVVGSANSDPISQRHNGPDEHKKTNSFIAKELVLS